MSKVKAKKLAKGVACCIPIVGAIVERLYNPNSTILHCLSLPNTVLAKAVIGDEKVLIQENGLIVCTNHYYVRYLVPAPSEVQKGRKKVSQFHGNKDFSIAVLAVRLNYEHRHFIDNIYVDEAYRREGIAS